MAKRTRAKYGLLFVFLITCLLTAAQANQAPPPDDEFNVFLLSFAALFMCTMIGAAIVGAFCAAFFFLFLFALISAGILSASVAVGLYKRSIAAGFKAFLMIVFAISCAVGGVGLAAVIHTFYPVHLSLPFTLIVGFLAGAFGGVLIGIALVAVIKTILRNVYNKMIRTS